MTNCQSSIRRFIVKKIIIGLFVLVLLAGGAYLSLGRGGTTADPAAQAAPVPAVKATDQVVAEANVVPARSAALSLPAGGIVADVLVEEGDQVSATRTNAQLALEQAANGVQQAQTTYSTARWNWQHAQQHRTDPLNPKNPSAGGGQEPNKLNDAQKQQYHDAFIQAEAMLHSA